MPSTPWPIKTAVLALLVSASDAHAQQQANAPVDRNVADTGPNAASQRYINPGNGQFGTGSLLTERPSGRLGQSPFEPARYDAYAGDIRTAHGQRYMLQAPGFAALLDQTDYIGLSPHGGWTRNTQTIDGSEILTLTGANTVYVLDHRLLRGPVNHTPMHLLLEQQRINAPANMLLPLTVGNPYQLMRDGRINNQLDNAYTQGLYGGKTKTTPPVTPIIDNQQQYVLAYDENYVHPEIIERRRKLKEEREVEEAAKSQAGTNAEESNSISD